jgi:hypothetical protein
MQAEERKIFAASGELVATKNLAKMLSIFLSTNTAAEFPWPGRRAGFCNFSLRKRKVNIRGSFDSKNI